MALRAGLEPATRCLDDLVNPSFTRNEYDDFDVAGYKGFDPDSVYGASGDILVRQFDGADFEVSTGFSTYVTANAFDEFDTAVSLWREFDGDDFEIASAAGPLTGNSVDELDLSGDPRGFEFSSVWREYDGQDFEIRHVDAQGAIQSISSNAVDDLYPRVSNTNVIAEDGDGSVSMWPAVPTCANGFDDDNDGTTNWGGTTGDCNVQGWDCGCQASYDNPERAEGNSFFPESLALR
jgi:hypothetical protein